MSHRGKLEGRITTDSWDITIDEGGGDVVVSLTDGTYYLSSEDSESDGLIAHLQSRLNSDGSLSNTYTVSIAAGEEGTGKVTLSADANFDVTWSTTALRDLLGFTGDVDSASSYESSQSARSLWLPEGSPPQTLNGTDVNWAGVPVSNKRDQVNDAGYTYSLAGQKRTERMVTWPAVKRHRVWDINETTENQSVEQFWEDVIYGSASWSARPGGPFRYYRDADTDGEYRTYVALGWERMEPQQRLQHWTGRWIVETGRWVEHPGGGTAMAAEEVIEELLDAKWHTPQVQEFPSTAADLSTKMGIS